MDGYNFLSHRCCCCLSCHSDEQRPHSLAVREFPAEQHVLSQGKPDSRREHARGADGCPQLAELFGCLPAPASEDRLNPDWAACEDSATQQSNPAWKLWKQIARLHHSVQPGEDLTWFRNCVINPCLRKGSGSLLPSLKTWVLAALDFLGKWKWNQFIQWSAICPQHLHAAENTLYSFLRKGSH